MFDILRSISKLVPKTFENFSKFGLKKSSILRLLVVFLLKAPFILLIIHKFFFCTISE